MTQPIRTRLTIIYCTVFCFGATVLEVGAYEALQLAVSAIADRDLNARLAGVEEFLNDHLPRMRLARMQKELKTHAALQPDLLRIATEGGPVVFETSTLARYTTEANSSTPRTWTAGDKQRPLRIMHARKIIKGVDYHLTLATDLTVPIHIVHSFGLLLLFTFPLVIAGAAAACHWMAGRALSPVLTITKAAHGINPVDLSRRIDVPESHDELRFLAETLNRMLARIEEAFRKTTDFTANASHELRTPLAVIRATAEVALMRDPNHESDRIALHQILRESEKNTTLLEDMLRLARADSGTLCLRLKPVDFAAIVRNTCQRCQPLALERGIRLGVDKCLEPVWVSADSEHLKRLLLILLDNAMKYTPDGGFVDVSMIDSGTSSAICQVTDTGIGIAETDLPRIFERFYRSDRARNRVEGGAGLGLAIAEWIAEAHNGKIEVESIFGSGSTFRIALPRIKGQESPTEPANHRILRKETEEQKCRLPM